MQIAVLKETRPRERRVALNPDSVSALVKSGAKVSVEKGAGTASHFSDESYATAGASICASGADAASQSDLVTKVAPPLPEEVAILPEGSTLVCMMQREGHDVIDALASRRITTLALERVPRITRAQSMDVLSSQATVAGYKAVLLGATQLGRLLPMLTTAAGNLAPARVFVLGAGVAGLQAIATARRLGGVVSAFDVRPAVREQVQSLGATFVSGAVSSEGTGGYARAQTEDERKATLAAIAAHISGIDLVISTAAIPGKAAPVLITEEMLGTMKPGSVIVDLAAETGGNCEGTKPGETVSVNGVTIIGPLNVTSTVPQHASQMFGRNVLTLLKHMIVDGSLKVDVEDEIIGAMAVTHAGEKRNV